jgi:hypothetical protein
MTDCEHVVNSPYGVAVSGNLDPCPWCQIANLTSKLQASDENVGLAKAALSELERTVIDLRSRLSSCEKERDAATDTAFRSATRARDAESRLDAAREHLRSIANAMTHGMTHERVEAARQWLYSDDRVVEKRASIDRPAISTVRCDNVPCCLPAGHDGLCSSYEGEQQTCNHCGAEVPCGCWPRV